MRPGKSKLWLRRKFTCYLVLLAMLFSMAGGAMNPALANAAGGTEGDPAIYTVTVDSAITGGTVTVDPASGAAGDTITVTVAPDEGKQLVAGSLKYYVEINQLSASDDDAVDAAINETASVYSFIMPAADVTVTAQFENITAALHSITQAPAPDGIWTITLDKSEAVAGETVTVTVSDTAYTSWATGLIVTGDSGTEYGFTTITAATGNANNVNDPGVYSFVMPDEPVTVDFTADYTTLDVYIQYGAAGEEIPVHSYTRAEMEALAEQNADPIHYAMYDRLPAVFMGKAVTYVTIEQLAASAATYNSDVRFDGPDCSLKGASLDGWTMGVNGLSWDYLMGQTRKYYAGIGDQYLAEENRTGEDREVPAVLAITGWAGRRAEVDNQPYDTLNTYRFFYGQTEAEYGNGVLPTMAERDARCTANNTSKFVNKVVFVAPDTNPVTNYTVTADSAITGGSIELSPASAAAGAAITVTVTPDEGKQLKAGSLKYTTDNGATYTAITATDGVYSFTLPAADTVVTAQFADSSAVVTGVSLDQSAGTLTVGSTGQLTAAITPAGAANQEVTWASDKPAAATVNSDGLVRATGTGSANITVTTVDGGFTATCAVTVRPASEDHFTIAVLPDTQFYAESYPEIFNQQTQWIAGQAAAQNIVFAAHLGDVQDDYDIPGQWQNARDAMAIIRNGGIPYSVTPGNHDLNFDAGDTTNFDAYFPYTDFTGYSWYGGHYPENSNASSYQLFSAMGQDFIVLNLVCNPALLADATNWANGVLTQYAGRQAIIVTHGYIKSNGDYAGGSNVSGPAIRDNIVKKHSNVIAVLCGHIAGQYHGTDTGDSGNTVYNLLTDYQDQPNGGNGWLRLYQFYPQDNILKAVTYSPYLDQYDTSADGQFELSLDQNSSATTWDGVSSSTDWSGAGTAADPYLINSAAQLKGLADGVNSGTAYSGSFFKLAQDLNLAGYDWLPIGGHCPLTASDQGAPTGLYFGGTFDGGNHTISGINIANPAAGTGAYGLFGYVNGGTIANLHVSGSLDMGDNPASAVGGVVGYITGSLYNLHSSMTITVNDPTTTTASQTGGIAGVVANTSSSPALYVRYCSNTGDVTGRGRMGGIVGAVYCESDGGVVVDQCFNTGCIKSVFSTKKIFTGGIAGYCEGYITNCYNQGNMETNNGHYLAGVVGILTGAAPIYPVASMSNCYSTANFTGYSPNYDRWLYASADFNPAVHITNCFYLVTNSDMTQPNADDSWGTQTHVSPVTIAQLQGAAEMTGSNRSGDFSGYVAPNYLGAADLDNPHGSYGFAYGQANSYPILAWQQMPDFMVDLNNLPAPGGNYTVSASVSGSGGTVTAEPPAVGQGGACVITLSPAAGYSLASLTDNGVDVLSAVENNTYTINNITINHTVVATFSNNTHALTYTAGAHGSLNGTLSQTVAAGDSGTAVTAVAEEGYHFAAWSDGVLANPRTDAAVNADIAVKAIFIIDDPDQLPEPDHFTIAVLPDTQFYSERYPAMFDQQTQWLADNARAQNIVFTAHLGDLVNDQGNTTQWQNARDAMSILRAAGMPYSVVPGNHDLSYATGDLTNYNTYFPYTDFSGCSWYGGHFPENNNASNYALFSAMGQDFILLNLVCAPTLLAEATDWANGILTQYSDRQAIVVTHGYIDTSGNYLEPSSVAGVAVWDNVVKHHSNVIAVLCGHLNGQYYGSDTGVNGNTVYNLLTDYQEQPNGGNGWLRLYQFYPLTNTLKAVTYSPYLDQYDTSAYGQFQLPLAQNAPGNNPKYTVTPVLDESVYTVGASGDGIPSMTVITGVIGLKYFGTLVTPVVEHEGSEALVFVHLRGGLQSSINVTRGDFDLLDEAQAGFNVQAGDMVRVYIVDDLTNNVNFNPTILH